MQISGHIVDESAMLALGAALAKCLKAGDRVFFTGPLGAGKTTLTRGILRALGYTARVASPTYAMVEEYDLTAFKLYHFDGYRIRDGQEWLDMGIDDYLYDDVVCLIEWPENGRSVLPEPTVSIDIALPSSGAGRDVAIILHQSMREGLSSSLKECLTCG